MRVLINLEHRFYKYNDAIYDDTTYNADFFKPYVESFGNVVVLARVKEISLITDKFQRVDIDNISFFELPDYNRYSFIYVIPKIIISLCRIRINDYDAVILRKPCRIGRLLSFLKLNSNSNYLIEYLGDMFDIAALKTSFISRYYAYLIAFWEKKQIKKAPIVTYVTKRYLQSHFPCGSSSKSFSWSDVMLERKQFVVKKIEKLNSCYTFIYTASFSKYKGHHYLPEIFKKLHLEGYQWKLVLIGDGVERKYIESKFLEYGINNHVEFTGNIPNNIVRSYLAKADVYISTSLTEGLPRAILEAMACSLPVVAFSVGGINELIDSKYLTKSGEISKMLDIIKMLYMDIDFFESASRNNYYTAQMYNVDSMKSSRLASYEALKQMAYNNKCK